MLRRRFTILVGCNTVVAAWSRLRLRSLRPRRSATTTCPARSASVSATAMGPDTTPAWCSARRLARAAAPRTKSGCSTRRDRRYGCIAATAADAARWRVGIAGSMSRSMPSPRRTPQPSPHAGRDAAADSPLAAKLVHCALSARRSSRLSRPVGRDRHANCRATCGRCSESCS